MDEYTHGVIENEAEHELNWSRSRQFSLSHCFDPVVEDNLQASITHYGVERVSAAKDCIGAVWMIVTNVFIGQL